MDIELLSVHTKSRPDSACMNGKSHMATDKNRALLSRDAADLARVGKKDVLKVCRADFGDDYLFQVRSYLYPAEIYLNKHYRLHL